MIVQSEAYTADLTRAEAELLLLAIQQYMPVLDKMTREDYEHLKRLEDKLRQALRLI